MDLTGYHQEKMEDLNLVLEKENFKVQKNVPLSLHTTFKIGGPAEAFVSVNDKESLVKAIDIAHSFSLPHFLLGGGSNILVQDQGMKGLVIQDRTSGFEIDRTTKTIKINSGQPLAEMVHALAEQGIGGLEFLAGIPGTVGGAVCGNAGAYGLSIKDVFLCAEVWRQGVIETISVNAMDYEYRNSRIKRSVKDGHFPEMVILSVILTIDLSPQIPPLKRVEEILEHRKGRLPNWMTGCGGSYFKNLPPLPGEERRRAAGMLLDEAGAKSLIVGGASVFKDHANVIINKGSATASEVLELAEMMKTLIREKHGIELEAEVMTVGY